ncbi:hypothetical protein Tco_0859235 [Tanacetum coccineum]|uniref:Uncharacterized protein n=1 Tax=Tanacetum coccineum TaxID=301880 RepID=A0ABQ5BED9_9ASTR
MSRSLLSSGFSKLWFSFAKRRAPSPICIDDNKSCMKGWKRGFFMIDRRAITDYMSWRRSNLVIADPKPSAGSYNQAYVRRLSAHVVKLRDMPEGVLRLPFYCTPAAAVDAAIPDPTPMDLAAVLPIRRSWPRPKLPRSEGPLPLAQPRAMLPNVLDAWVEILLITPIRFAATIPTGGNQSGDYAPFAAEGPSHHDPTSDDIDMDFFPFAPGPYYATYPEDGVVVDSYETMLAIPTPGEMVRIEALTDDRLTGKMSVLYCLMVSHRGEFLARYRGLSLWIGNVTVLSATSALWAYFSPI